MFYAGGWSSDGITLPGTIDLESTCLRRKQSVVIDIGIRQSIWSGMLRSYCTGDDFVDQGFLRYISYKNGKVRSLGSERYS